MHFLDATVKKETFIGTKVHFFNATVKKGTLSRAKMHFPDTNVAEVRLAMSQKTALRPSIQIS